MRVTPEAYYLFDTAAAGVPELCDAFKVRYVSRMSRLVIIVPIFIITRFQAKVHVDRQWSWWSWWWQDSIRRPHPWPDTCRWTRNPRAYVCAPGRQDTEPLRSDWHAPTRRTCARWWVHAIVHRIPWSPAVRRGLPDTWLPTTWATSWVRPAASRWCAAGCASIARCYDPGEWMGPSILI